MGDNDRDAIIEFLVKWDMQKARGLSHDELLSTLELLLNDAYWAETDEYLLWLQNERMGG